MIKIGAGGGDTSRRFTPYSSGQRRILLSSHRGPSSPLARGVNACQAPQNLKNFVVDDRGRGVAK